MGMRRKPLATRESKSALRRREGGEDKTSGLKSEAKANGIVECGLEEEGEGWQRREKWAFKR